MSKHNVVELSGRETVRDELTELIRDGARKLIREALESEVSELLSDLSGRRNASGRAAVVRNGSRLIVGVRLSWWFQITICI